MNDKAFMLLWRAKAIEKTKNTLEAGLHPEPVKWKKKVCCLMVVHKPLANDS
jgi:hypothetical protein